MARPRLLIEDWLPTRELGIESVRERAAASALPPLYFLHVWWARRPLVASAGAVLGSVLPAWSPELAERFPDRRELSSEQEYRQWFLRLCGILGDPVAADALTRAARESGQRIPNNPFTYKQAYKNPPSSDDLELLHEVLNWSWGRVPTVLDPTAGGGSIPFEAIRYGLPAHANDLNSIAAAVLRAGVELPARFGLEIAEDLKKWGTVLCERLRERLQPFFPDGPDGPVATFLFARTVSCPRTGKLVPLAPNWWLSKDKGGVAVRLVTERNGVELDEPEFEIVRGDKIDQKATDAGTITRGQAVSPWDHLVIDGDYIKAEAQAGRMGSVLYAVAVRGSQGRDFRAPIATDLQALRAAEEELQRVLPKWEAEDVVPDEMIPDGLKTAEPLRYGMRRWRDMFSPRQLLVHGTFVEEFWKLIDEVRGATPDRDEADVILSILALIQGKGINFNSLLSSWHVSRGVMRSVFERHDFAFKWTWAEFEGARELCPWALEQVVDAYRSIAELLHPSEGQVLTSGGNGVRVPAKVEATQGNAGDMRWLGDGSVDLVCIDPPYYDNVMYAELADFFYVWEKRTLGHLWPELFSDELTNKEEEAVANEERWAHAGRKKKTLAALDYEKKMTQIFAECRRVLSDDGVMTVMFTHKKAEAWDTLGESLLDSGFSIEASWPVPTESEHSLHQANKAAAASTVFLVCRKRPEVDRDAVFFDSIEAEVREAARDAYHRLTDWGIEGVDRLLATYGPALSVLSRHWPVYSSEADPETGRARLLRPEEALVVAQKEVTRLQRARLGASHVDFDPITDFWLLAWDTFGFAEFPFDEARKLCLAVGGVEVDDLVRAKVLTKKSGSVVMVEPKGRLRRDADDELPGVNRDRVSFPVLLDALHTALYVLELDGAAAAKTWLEQRRLSSDSRFQTFVQAAINAVPRRRTKGELVLQEAKDLDSLVRVAFAEVVTVPADELTSSEGQLAMEL